MVVLFCSANTFYPRLALADILRKFGKRSFQVDMLLIIWLFALVLQAGIGNGLRALQEIKMPCERPIRACVISARNKPYNKNGYYRLLPTTNPDSGRTPKNRTHKKY